VKSEKGFKRLTERILDLPTLPGIVLKLNELIRNPRTSAQQIGELIAQDQVLAAKALKLVNSAFYGFPRKITNITHAIVILGFQKVRDIIMTTSIFDLFKGEKIDIKVSTFWEHSLTTAITSEAVARKLGSPEVTDAFIAGLLHDIGKLILAIHGTKEYRAVRKTARECNLTSHEAEMEVLGFHHGNVGAWLTEKWRFPAKVVRTIRLHHSPEAARENRELNSIVHLADVLAHAVSISDVEERICTLSHEVWDEFNLSDERLAAFYSQTGKGLEKAQDFFALIPNQ
jgi:putative nucleotidyltransferase with HDIG domain